MSKLRKIPFFAPQLYGIIKNHYYEEELKKKLIREKLIEESKINYKTIVKKRLNKTKTTPPSKSFLSNKIISRKTSALNSKLGPISKISTSATKTNFKTKSIKFNYKKSKHKPKQIIFNSPKNISELKIPKARSIVFKISHRSSTILPYTGPFSFLVDNGRIKTLVNINPNIIGHKFGEFTKTRRRYYYRNKKKQNRSRKK